MMSEGLQGMLEHGSNVASVCSGSLGDAVLVALVREEMQVLFVQLTSAVLNHGYGGVGCTALGWRRSQEAGAGACHWALCCGALLWRAVLLR